MANHWRTTGGRKDKLEGAEGAAEDTRKGGRQGGVRGGKGRGAVRQRGATASRREKRGVGGSEEVRGERGVQGTGRRADREGTLNKMQEGQERARRAAGEGTGEGRATGNGMQGAGEGRTTRSRRQGAMEGRWWRVHGATGVPGQGKRWMVRVCHRPAIPPFPPPPMYPGALPPASMQQHPQA